MGWWGAGMSKGVCGEVVQVLNLVQYLSSKLYTTLTLLISSNSLRESHVSNLKTQTFNKNDIYDMWLLPPCALPPLEALLL